MKYYFNRLIVILFLLPLLGNSQSLTFNCILVNPGGDAFLYWSIDANNNVEKYRIYYSYNGVNFTVIDTINDPAITQYHHLTAQANTGIRKYFIEAVINGANSVYSDTLNTIYLQLDNSDPGWAKLYWNAVHTPLPNGSSQWYKILREYPQGVWNIVDSTQNTQYFHWADVCNDSLTFFIYIENNSCHSTSNLIGGQFKDIEYPDKPLLDSVSINNNDNVELGWTASDSSDVAGYIIYRFEDAVWIEIDTVFGKENTFFIDTTVNACDENYEYAIASIDSCGNKSPGTFLFPQRPILLYPIGFSTCSLEDTLHWKPYINATPPIEKYEIFASSNGNAFTKIGEVQPNIFSFIHQGLNYETTYSYFVRAIFGNKSATSCSKELFTINYIRPHIIYLENANVFPDNTVQISIHVDTTVHNSSWEVWRSDDNGSNFAKFRSLNFSNLSSFPLQTIDETIDASTQSYFYKVYVLDSCGNIALQSNILNTIHLTGTFISAQKINLKWNAIEGWQPDVLRYRIYKMEGETYPANAYDSVDSHTFTYNDDISNINIADGRFTYWIQAVEDTGNAFGYEEIANSNRILLQQESKIYFPNAFRPNGINKIFRPLFTFFGGTEYLFQIYNRWGQLIFESHNPTEGWDGTYNGNKVETGVYIYLLSYKNVFGDTIQKRGTVSLIN